MGERQPESRLKTLLQTFDSARFDDKNAAALGISSETLAADIKEDLALARSEVLGSLLFGHDIVIPAGMIADSPVFIEVFREVLTAGSENRARLAKRRGGDPYRPFRVGLEPQYIKSVEGRTGYDAFVARYLGEYRPGRIDLRVIAALEAKTERSQDENLVLVGNAYLNRKPDDVGRFDPEYGRHIELVAQEFGDKVLHPISPVLAATNCFSEGSTTIYGDTIRKECAGIGNYPGQQKILDITAQIEKDLRDGNQEAYGRERGTWYRNGLRYEVHWPIVRGWLDRLLTESFVHAFRVALPSFFTQKLSTDPEIADASLTYMRRRDSLAAVHPGIEALLPTLATAVNWTAVWDIVAQDDVQQRMSALQAVLTGTHHRDGIVQLGSGADSSERDAIMNEAWHEKRLNDVAKAIDDYVSFLNSGQSSLVLKHDGKRITATAITKPRPAILKKSVDVGASAVVGTAAAAAAAAFALPIPASISASAAAFFVGNFALNAASGGGYELLKAGRDKVLGIVQRNPDNVATAFGDAEKARMSVWSTFDQEADHSG